MEQRKMGRGKCGFVDNSDEVALQMEELGIWAVRVFTYSGYAF